MICGNTSCSSYKQQNGVVCDIWQECLFFKAEYSETKQSRKTANKALKREDDEQAEVVAFCDEHKIPCIHIPNEGKRSKVAGANLKRIGMRKGVPDLFITVARGCYHGLFVEMKAVDGKVSKEQMDWQDELTRRGYKAVFAWGASQAMEMIKDYLAKE